jgi:hypothetical protein
MLLNNDVIGSKFFLEETLKDGLPWQAECMLMSCVSMRTDDHAAAKRYFDFYAFASNPWVMIYPGVAPLSKLRLRGQPDAEAQGGI